MDDNKPLEEAVQRWLDIAIERYRFYIDKYNVGFTQSLWNSFTESIIRGSGGDISKLEISFLYYGRFVDMGVGRGYYKGSRKQLGDHKYFKYRNVTGQTNKVVSRKARKWYSKTTSFEIMRLSQILSEQFGLNVDHLAKNSLSNINVEIEF